MKRSYQIALFLNVMVSIPFSTNAQNWQALGGGTSMTIRDIYADSANNLLYLGGNFEFAGGVTVNQLGVWDGNSWSTIDGGSGEIGCSNGCSPILSIRNYQGETFVAGSHSMMGGDVNNKYLSRFNGSQWTSCGNPYYGEILLETIGNNLFAFVFEDTLNGNFIPVIASWNGSEWIDFGTNLPPASSSLYLWNGVEYQGDLYFGGNFDMDIDNIHEIIKWDGTNWSGLANGGIIGDAYVNAMAVYGNQLWIGGYFFEADGNVNDYLMVWDGQQWSNPFPGIQFTGQVKDLQVIENELYIVGAHEAVADTGHYGIARYDGTMFRSFGGSYNYPTHVAGLNGEVYVVSGPFFNDDDWKFIYQWMGGDSVDYSYYAALDVPEFSDNSFKVYPNPASETITIQFDFPLKQNLPVRLIDIQGRLIKEELFLSGELSKLLQLGEVRKGCYFLSLGEHVEMLIVN